MLDHKLNTSNSEVMQEAGSQGWGRPLEQKLPKGHSPTASIQERRSGTGIATRVPDGHASPQCPGSPETMQEGCDHVPAPGKHWCNLTLAMNESESLPGNSAGKLPDRFAATPPHPALLNHPIETLNHVCTATPLSSRLEHILTSIWVTWCSQGPTLRFGS